MSRAVGIELRVEQDGLFCSTSGSLVECHQGHLSAKLRRSEQNSLNPSCKGKVYFFSPRPLISLACFSRASSVRGGSPDLWWKSEKAGDNADEISRDPSAGCRVPMYRLAETRERLDFEEYFP